MVAEIKIAGAGGEYMEAVTVVEWKVSAGDKVAEGQVVAVVETAKAATEVEAPATGVLLNISAVPGDEVAVGAVLGRIDDGSGDVADAAGDSPADDKLGQRHPAVPEDRGQAAARHRKGGRIFASPLARRVAGELGLDLATVGGSGPGGRIKKRDVLHAHEMRETVPRPGPEAAASAPDDRATLALYEEASYELVPHSKMRSAIAARLTASKSTVPHFYLNTDCRIDALRALRANVNEAAPADDDGHPAYRVSLNDLVVMAFARALAGVRDANVTWTSQGLLRHSHADVAVAVAVDGGLITPIVRRADEKSLSEISNELRGLAERAREGLLAPGEYQGGSSAVSNLGMYGIDSFSAIINPPHASILAVGAAREATVVQDGTMSPAWLMTATLSVDHRAIDGAVAAQLLAAFRGFVEQPSGMLV